MKLINYLQISQCRFTLIIFLCLLLFAIQMIEYFMDQFECILQRRLIRMVDIGVLYQSWEYQFVTVFWWIEDRECIISICWAVQQKCIYANLLWKFLHRFDDQIVQGQFALVLSGIGFQETSECWPLATRHPYGIFCTSPIVDEQGVCFQDGCLGKLFKWKVENRIQLTFLYFWNGLASFHACRCEPARLVCSTIVYQCLSEIA